MTLRIKEWIDNMKNGKIEPIDNISGTEIKYIWDVINNSNKDGIILNLIGIMNQCGYGASDGMREAIKYYKMAAEFKNENAICMLAYIHDRDVIYKNIPEAIKYYKMLIENTQCNINTKYDRNIESYLSHAIECIFNYNNIKDNCEYKLANIICELADELNKYNTQKTTELEYIFRLYSNLNRIISKKNIYGNDIICIIFTRICSVVKTNDIVLTSLMNKYEEILTYNNRIKTKIITLLIANSQNEKSCVFGIDSNIIHNIICLL